MKVVSFEGLGEFAFRDVRFGEDGAATDHPFNNPAHGGASVLLVNRNFGCGSSREHAPQALMRWGIRAVIGESFAEIFAGNCNALGIPAVTVAHADIEELMRLAEGDPQVVVSIDLERRTVEAAGHTYPLEMPQSYLQSLTGGTWDSTAVLLENADKIRKTAGELPYLTSFSK